MGSFNIGDRVRIDIPNENDPDHRYHAEHGTVTNIISDDAGETTGDNRDSDIYRVSLENEGGVVDVRVRDLRSPFSDEPTE